MLVLKLYLYSNMKFKEITPVCKLSDQCTFFFAGVPLLLRSSSFQHYFFLQFSTVVTTFFRMEDLDEQLLVTKIEVSCWEDQLKQAVSLLQLNNILYAIHSNSIQSQVHHFNNYVFHYILPFSGIY